MCEIVKTALQNTALPLAEVARRMGVKRQQITKWRNGATPRPDTKTRLLNVLGVTVRLEQRIPGDALPEAPTP